MIGSLLVPLDASEHAGAATGQALDLAKAYGARVTGLYVLDIRYLEMPPYLDYSNTFEAVPPTILPVEVLEKYREKSERILGGFRDAAEQAGVEVETRTEEGVPSKVIADIGLSHDLIIIGKQGEHAKWDNDLLGSTAEGLVRRSGTPVLLAEGENRPLKSIMVLYDGSAPASRALKLATDIATHVGAGLEVFTANDDPEQGAATLKEASSYLEALSLGATYTLEDKEAHKAITATLEDEHADLVVMGTRGHSALHYLVLGSTAEHILRSTALPVLLVP